MTIKYQIYDAVKNAASFFVKNWKNVRSFAKYRIGIKKYEGIFIPDYYHSNAGGKVTGAIPIIMFFHVALY